MTSLDDISEKLACIKSDQVKHSARLASRRGARDQLIRTIQNEVRAITDARLEQELHSKAQVFLLAELSLHRQKAIDSIEQMSSTALGMIYEQGTGLKFDTFDEKRSADGTKNFKAELRVTSVALDGSEVSCILQGGGGGGVHEISATVLRQSALDWLGYSGPVLWDESFKFMSHDEKIESLAKFVREYASITGRQIIFATHMLGVFGSVADNIVKLKREDGRVVSESLNPSDVSSIEEYEWDEDAEDN